MLLKFKLPAISKKLKKIDLIAFDLWYPMHKDSFKNLEMQNNYYLGSLSWK